MDLSYRNLLLIVLATLLLVAISCGEVGDPRYDKWGKYTDPIDYYMILVPPGWTAEGDTIPGMRGTRFTPVDQYTGDLAGFVYFSVFVTNIENPEIEADERAESLVRAITEGVWNDLELEKEVATLAGKPSIRFEMSGLPLYTSYKLKGIIEAVEHDGKVFLLFASATENSYMALREQFGLIYNSFRLP